MYDWTKSYIEELDTMKIGFVTPFFSPRAGGSAIAPYQLARQLVRKGHEVVVFTSDVYRDTLKFPDEHGLRILQSKCVLTSSGFYYSPAMVQSIRENVSDVDVLHMHNFRTYQNIISRKVAVESRLPYILQAHGSVPPVTKRFSKWLFDEAFGSRILRDAWAIIASSQMEIQEYISVGVDPHKLVTIPVGIDTQDYASLPAPGQFRAKFGLGDDVKMILYLGRIDKTKGIGFLLKSYARLRLKGTNSTSVLVLAGPDGGYMNNAKRLARKLRVDDHIIITGMLSEYPKMCALSDADLIVSPCYFESFGLATIEGAAASKPVIVIKDTPMAHFVEGWHFGMTATYDDFDEFSREMATILDDTQIGMTMGSNGRKFVFANLDWVGIASEYEKTYETAARNRRRAD